MLLLLYCSLSAATFLSSNDNIFRGVEDLDQEVDEDITSGGDVSFGSFPYVVAVFNSLRKLHTCAGAIIHSKIVITAGYCVSEGGTIVNSSYVSVIGGVVDMRDHDQDQWRYAVEIAGSDATYKGTTALVLIKVNTPFFINYSLRTVNYLTHSYGRNTICTALTWRFRDKLNRLTLKNLVLKQYLVFVLNQTNCMSMYSSNPILLGLSETGFICMNFVAFMDVGSHNYECVGVDGSMIFCDESGELHAIGIASTLVGGSTCNRLDDPFTFFDFGASFSWIEKEVLRLLFS